VRIVLVTLILFVTLTYVGSLSNRLVTLFGSRVEQHENEGLVEGNVYFLESLQHNTSTLYNSFSTLEL